LGVWAGPYPRDDRHAGELFARLTESMNQEMASVPTASLAAFARTLVTRWPELDVWATAEGIRVEASEEPELVERIVTEVAALATRQGMVCYDPQRESRIA
jgi:hypothetical protein